MTLSRTDVTTGMIAELEAFEDVVRSLASSDLAAPSRCEGWTVADVAAHVIGTHTDIAAGRLDGLGTPEVTEREVAERRGHSAEELADELVGSRKAATDLLALFDDAAWVSPAPGGYPGTLGEAVEALWFDAYLHGDDIRAAIGMASEPGDGIRASLSHIAGVLTARGWGPATLALDGYPTFEVAAGGAPITGDALAFVLAATGRSDPESIGLDSTVNIYAD